MPAPFAMPCRGSCVACCPTGVPGAGGTGRCVCRWGRPAREIATREPAARSGRSRGPPWPCRHPPAPRPGPTTAHRHRGQALRLEARPCPPVPPAPFTPAVLCRWRVAGCVVSKLVPALLSLTVARCRRCVTSPDCVRFASLHARSLISHVIPLRLFQDLNCDRWYFNVSACCCGGGSFELRAIILGVGLKIRVGVADPLRETGFPVLVRACVGLKPASPLRARTWLGLKPTSPLRVRYGCFWWVFWLQWCRRFQWLLFRGAQW